MATQTIRSPRSSRFHPAPIAAAAWLCLAGSWAPPAAAQLAPVTVSGRAEPSATVGGWGDVPLSKLPLAASVYGTEQLRDRGAQRLADLVGADAAVSDGYNSEGYWDFLTVRGYVLDNRFNYRRDGLPINAETSIALDNKSRVEVLKGTSGLQAGTSAPGGLVNLVVKRPLDVPLRSASLEWRERSSLSAALDLGQRFGADGAFGVRLNAAAATLRPELRNADGRRHLLALAADARLSPTTLIEAEFETSSRRQPSQAGFSLRGDVVPEPGDPRINLNNQPWSQPVLLDGDTASLRLTQRLAGDWRFSAHGATQRLRSDDRVAFPYGCFDPSPAPDGTYYADRYCPDGSFDLYDFRSENERRRSDALDLSFSGTLTAAGMTHALQVGVLTSRVQNRFQRQAYNYAGSGRDDGSVFTPAAPDLTDENTNRDERATEFHLRDAIGFAPGWTAWLGLRHTRLQRSSARTDGSRPTDYAQSITTPFAALSKAITPTQTVYASWSRGAESDVAPNRERYTNAGQALPALRSRQTEIGWKGGDAAADWNLAAFDIVRPLAADIGACDDPGTCTRRFDGTQRHRGVEANGALRQGDWTLRAGAQWLRARVEGRSDPTLNGLAPANVAERTLKLQAEWMALPALALQAGVVHEGKRYALPDNSASIPGWTRADLGARFTQRAGGTTLTWRAGIDNLFDERAWRESPYQFGHAYLFPLAPRALRVSLQADL